MVVLLLEVACLLDARTEGRGVSSAGSLVLGSASRLVFQCAVIGRLADDRWLGAVLRL